MIAIHRGAGMLAPLFGILFALIANVVTFRIFGGSYYEEHRWPKFGVLVMSGLACLIAGIALKKKRQGEAYREHRAIEALSKRHQTANLIAFSGPRDHLMFIPLEYWSIVYMVAAIVYVLVSEPAPHP